MRHAQYLSSAPSTNSSKMMFQLNAVGKMRCAYASREAFSQWRVATAFTFFAAFSIKFANLVYPEFMPVDCRLALSFGDYGGEHGQESEEGKEGKEDKEDSKKEVTVDQINADLLAFLKA
jgi:hypothetical protein